MMWLREYVFLEKTSLKIDGAEALRPTSSAVSGVSVSN
jgi:hypothetical protein